MMNPLEGSLDRPTWVARALASLRSSSFWARAMLFGRGSRVTKAATESQGLQGWEGLRIRVL